MLHIWLLATFACLSFSTSSQCALITPEDIKCASISECSDCLGDFCKTPELWLFDICDVPLVSVFCRATCTDCVRPSNVGSWSEFQIGSCSVTCAGGTRRNTRSCIGGIIGDHGCEEGRDEMQEECNTHKCPVWAPYGKWSDCSVSCGGGLRISTRTCRTFGVEGAECEGNSARVEECNKQDCPRWDNFSSFVRCSVTCGGGVSTATRRCIGGNPGDLGCEGNTTKIRLCNQGACGMWSDWELCSVSCGGGNQNRYLGSETQTRSCGEQLCPYWGNYEEFGGCSQSCNGGIQVRTRECVNGEMGQAGCIGLNMTSRDCNTHACNSWGPWEKEACTKSCEGGMRNERRSCRGGIREGEGCEGRDKQLVPCNTQPCPRWGPWEPFGPCSDTCGFAVKCSTRQCLHGEDGQRGCHTGLPFRLRECANVPCQNVFSPWSSFSACNASCSGGMKYRQRTCPRQERCPADEYGKVLIQAVECNTQRCPPTWSEWDKSWPCSKTCGKGEHLQRRRCIRAPDQDECEGVSARRATCMLEPCPARWDLFSIFSTCTVSCGGGTQSRTRKCLYGEIGTGSCMGSATHTRNCNTQPCPCVSVQNQIDNYTCCKRAARGQCNTNPMFMLANCEKACCQLKKRARCTGAPPCRDSNSSFCRLFRHECGRLQLVKTSCRKTCFTCSFI